MRAIRYPSIRPVYAHAVMSTLLLQSLSELRCWLRLDRDLRPLSRVWRPRVHASPLLVRCVDLRVMRVIYKLYVRGRLHSKPTQRFGERGYAGL